MNMGNLFGALWPLPRVRGRFGHQNCTGQMPPPARPSSHSPADVSILYTKPAEKTRLFDALRNTSEYLRVLNEAEAAAWNGRVPRHQFRPCRPHL